MTQGAVRVWEKGKRSWKRFCALALAAVLLWSMVPVTPARAKEMNGITFTPLEYDMGEQTLKVAVSIEAADKYLAYYVYNRSVTGEMTNEQKFEAAVKTGTTSAEVVCPVSKIIYAWYVDKDGNCLSDHSASGSNDPYQTNGIYIANMFDILCDEALAEESTLRFVNGTELENIDMTYSNGVMEWDTGNEEYNKDNTGLYVKVKKGSATFGTDTYYSRGSLDISSYVNEAGEYTVFWGFRKLSPADPLSKISCRSFSYQKPSQQMASLPKEAVSWEEGKTGVIRVSLEDYADLDRLGSVTVNVVRVGADGRIMVRSGMGTLRSKVAENVYEMDVSNQMKQEGYTYQIELNFISNDIDHVANTINVPYLTYDPAQASDSLQKVLAELGVDSVGKATADSIRTLYDSKSEAEKQELAGTLKGALASLETNELKVAMQTREETFQLVKTIEELQGVTVSTNVAGDVQGIIHADSVSVTGAGLNADAGVSNVSLDITKVSEDLSAQWNADSAYKQNAVPLGITLTGCSKAVPGLDVPVTVTMSVPVGIDMDKLVILHLNADGSVEERLNAGEGYKADYADRTVTFTVTHFSTFVFAETAEGTTPGDDGNGGGSGTPGDNENGSGSGTPGDDGNGGGSGTPGDNENGGGSGTPGDNENGSGTQGDNENGSGSGSTGSGENGTSGSSAQESRDDDERDNHAGSFTDPVDVDWNAVLGSLGGAKAGENVNVAAGKQFCVPTEVIRALAGKDVTLALEAGNGTVFSLSGRNIRTAGKAFELSLSELSGIPETAKNTVTAGAALVREFSGQGEGVFPYPVGLHMALGAENAGKTAYLYRYDAADGKLKLSGSFRITQSGQALFGMNRGGHYLAVVSGNSENMAEKSGEYTVVSGDSLYRIAARYRIRLNDLLRANPQLKDPNRIYPGQRLTIPVQ